MGMLTLRQQALRQGATVFALTGSIAFLTFRSVISESAGIEA